MKKIFLLLLFSFVWAKDYDLQSLKKYENSIAKDYYIHRLLEQKAIDKKQAAGLGAHIFRYVGKIKDELETIIPPKPYTDPKFAACYGYVKEAILDANASCQELRLRSNYFITSLKPQTRSALALEFQAKNPSLAVFLEAFNQTNPLALIVQKESVGAFFRYYNYSKKNDHDLGANFVNKLAQNASFKAFAQQVIIRQEGEKFRKSLLRVSPELVSEDSAFYLGVNALVFEDENLAYEFFKRAYESFKMQSNKDNALFWMWKIKGDGGLLEALANSASLNIYSIYAKELLARPFVELSVLEAKETGSDFDMQDPFAWQDLAVKIRKANDEELKILAQKFNTKNTLPIYAIIMEKLHQFKKHYFIMPYFEHIKGYDPQRQSLILAIARQESRFIPTAISTSYALGMMQFMPFLANHIGHKELKIENFDQDFMFEPQMAYRFANHHLDYLQKHLHSPLLVFYAYNGGIGFTRKMLKQGLFRGGKFEPFLSMELVPYQESRIYGKKVLANYIAYQHLLSGNTKISDIFENLIQSKQIPQNKP